MRRGFTLIELLVVIAIIAILASILFPVFARAREKARQTSCLSNMKQIGLATQMYAEDYDECLPLYDYDTGTDVWIYWMQEIHPYVKNTQVFECPSHKVQPSGSDWWQVPLPGINLALVQLGYGWNTGCYVESGGSVNKEFVDGRDDGLDLWGTALAAIGDPSSTILIGEMKRVYDNQAWVGFIKNDPTQYFAGRHNGGDNLSFVDGHAKWYSKSTLAGKQAFYTIAED